MNNDLSVHGRCHNDKVCSSRWVSIRHVLEDASALLGADDATPGQDWLESQFASNNCRALQNERHFG